VTGQPWLAAWQSTAILPSEALGPAAVPIWPALVSALGAVPLWPPVIAMLVHWPSAAGLALAVAGSPITMAPKMIPAATNGPERVAVMRRVNGVVFMVVSS
jgi:hypothetical protein